MRKLFLVLFLGFIFIFNSCDTEQNFIIPNNSFSFRLLNFTDFSYENATLFIGGKDSSNQFIATDSISYAFVPSNQSPNGIYTNLDHCSITCGNNGWIDGYHYFFQNGNYFVDIPFQPNANSWNPDITKVLEISDELTFVIKFAGGLKKEIQGYNIRKTIIENPVPINTHLEMKIKSSGIESSIRF